MAKDSKKVAAEFAKELLEKLGVVADVETTVDDSGIKVAIKGENLGALIGYHGQTLESLQLILGLMVNHQLKAEDWQRVIVDVGEYRAERESTLKQMIDRSVAELKDSGKAENLLPVMSAAERRSAHIIISENYPELETVSEGEEPYRRIKLFKKAA